jgi:hypothetical protein
MNPTVSPADKLMQAIANLEATITDKLKHNHSQQLQDLQQIVTNISSDKLPQPPASPSKPDLVPRVHNEQPVLRVHTARAPVAPTPVRLRKRKKHSFIGLTQPVHNPTKPPAGSICSKTLASRQATATARASSRICQTTASSRSKTRLVNVVRLLPRGTADAKFLRAFCKLEDEIEHAMHVLDKESGKMLNYRQLLHHPKYTEAWSLSSANEFGRLAQGVCGRIKGTDTIRFIQESDVTQIKGKI